ncbi:MAG: hypothetical protein DME82_01415 [Verrucomicrobia bacterium]|nr:MAG: hypothetical protein DME82_01415 [Verrucomicrobiota bacterium]
MSVQVYGCNHVAIEVDDVEKAVAFYKDVFNLEQMSGGEGDAFFKLGEHQFLAIFEVEKVQRANMRHFGIMVRDEAQLDKVREKITKKYKLKLEPPFRCDFRDPWGNRIQVVDLHDESLIWLLPYREVQKIGIKCSPCAQRVKPVVWQSQRSATPLSAQTCRSMFRLSQARNQMACALPCESVIHKQAAVFNDFIYRTRLQRRA